MITRYAAVLIALIFSIGFTPIINAQSVSTLKRQLKGNYQEILDKTAQNPGIMNKIVADMLQSKKNVVTVPNNYGVANIDSRPEVEPNNFFNTADELTVADENKLIEATFTEGDIDVYKFEVDTTKMYYIVSTHSFLENGDDDLVHVLCFCKEIKALSQELVWGGIKEKNQWNVTSAIEV
jgi:hypothetical protein